MISVFSEFDLNNLILDLNEIDNVVLPHELSEIMSKYKSDKGFGLSNAFLINNILPPNLVCHNYTFFYEKLFSKYVNEPITIFEMGVGVPPCMGVGSWAGSLLGWKEYFSNSKILSADFDKNYLYCDDRITSYYVNQEQVSSIQNLWSNIDTSFDIIIDDGPHTYSSNLLFYTNSIHKLKTNGFFIIEDINLDFIDLLYDNVVEFNSNNNINCNIIKLIIPWPKKFSHVSKIILNMNNLIILQKL